MGLTERHWFEDEEPELTERQLEDAIYENKKAYDNGYAKGFNDAKMLYETEELVRKIELILIEEGQHDKRFKFGDFIKYTPSEVAEILKKHADEFLT